MNKKHAKKIGALGAFGKLWLVVVYVFLFMPIITLVVFSFNDSVVGISWGGFSTRWYYEIFDDEKLINGFLLSLEIAFWSATLATILGTFAAFVLVRYRRFFGKNLFVGMISAPMVMPEVITGLSLLLLMVMLQNLFGVPERGATTIFLGHTLFAMAFATVVVRSRLQSFDQRIEEAAMDLGARPLEVFFLVTLPLIFPSLLSAWLLSFTLSFDDVVLASFLHGPDSETLPVQIIARARKGVTPVVNVVAAITVFVVSFIAIFVCWGLMKKQKNKENEALIGLRQN